jgi:Rps23 Pro-64 3,4-dihydroxylase Tpa1-like proline 4-hydroxylase
MTEVLMPDRKTLTPFDGVLVTIRSEKSFFEVTKAIESRLQRFSISKLNLRSAGQCIGWIRLAGR